MTTQAAQRMTTGRLRRRAGLVLLALYPVLYLVIPIAPALPLDLAGKAVAVGVVLTIAELALLASIALLGKDAVRSVKRRIGAALARRRVDDARPDGIPGRETLRAPRPADDAR